MKLKLTNTIIKKYVKAARKNKLIWGVDESKSKMIIVEPVTAILVDYDTAIESFLLTLSTPREYQQFYDMLFYYRKNESSEVFSYFDFKEYKNSLCKLDDVHVFDKRLFQQFRAGKYFYTIAEMGQNIHCAYIYESALHDEFHLCGLIMGCRV